MGGGRKRPVWAGVRLVALAVVVFVVPVLVTLELKHVGERGVQAERDLQAVVTELVVQDGLEWRVISGRVSPQEVSGDLAASRARAESLLDYARDDGLDAVAAARLRELNQEYAGVVDEELRLLEADEDSEAEEFDEEQVDPAFERAQEALAEQAERVSVRADRARSLSDYGMLVTVLLSLALTTVVQSRRRRAEVGRGVERRSEARYRALVDQSTELVLVTDRDGVVSFLSPAAERLLAVGDPGSVPTDPGRGRLDLLAAVEEPDRLRLAAALRDAAPGSISVIEVRIAGGEGVRTFEMSVQDLTEQTAVTGLVLTGHDVTDRLRLQEQMEYRSLHDTLTGLPNRALLSDRFEQALRGAQRDGTATGLLLIDLDRFKEINDTFGHHYGDALLTQVGPRLTGVLRGVDTVARLGGDEFAVLLPGVHDVEAVIAVAAKLQTALTEPFHVEGVDLDVEASFGAVLSGAHGTDPSTLLQHADIAMYVAKTQNLGVFAYDPAVDGHSSAKLALLGDLRRSLDRGELVLHYQPKISISTGEVVGAEALVRWQHPERGLVFPDSFIPLAEHTGLIGPLTRHVLSTALAQARSWADAGRPLAVSVNLSARNLLDERLPDQVAELLATHGVPAVLLELEVTESAIMTEPARAQRVLEQLAALGVRLSIDDFGAGYTSLGQLKSLPVTELKIDKSFVMTMNNDRSNAVIVHSVIDLGHNLGLTMVAEGVETAQDLAALADYGCDIAQGYHFSRPLPADAFDTFCAEHSLLPPPTTIGPSPDGTTRHPGIPELAAEPTPIATTRRR